MFNELNDDDFGQRSRSCTGQGQMFPITKLLGISLMLFDIQASFFESMYNTIKDFNDSLTSVDKRSRSIFSKTKKLLYLL